MRIQVLLPIFLFSLAGTPLISQNASQSLPGGPETFGTIQGTVTRSGSTEPIPGVQITVNGSGNTLATLMGMNPNSPQLQAMAESILGMGSRGGAVPAEILQAAQEALPDSTKSRKPVSAPLTAVSGSDGRFTIPNVPAGTTVIRAQLQGYFAPPVNGSYSGSSTMNVVTDARKTTDVHLSLIPGGSISGRILDADGRPLSDISVQLLTAAYDKGKLSLQPADIKMTDDRGEYRMYRLRPGQYYVIASPPSSVTKGARGGNSAPHEIAVPTLYPNVLDVASAHPVVLRSGDELTGINIQVRKAMGAELSGRVVSSLPPGPVMGARGQARPSVANIILMQRDGIGLPEINGGGVVVLNGGTGITADSNGNFSIPDVPPGSYEIFARLPAAPNTAWGTANPPARATTPWALGRVSVDVHGASVDNIGINVRPGFDLKGKVFVDGLPASAGLRISLLPDDIASAINDGPGSLIYDQIGQYHPPIGSDGSFTFPLLPEGTYRFHVSFDGAESDAAAIKLPANAYIADVRQESVSVYDSGVVVGSTPPSSVEVVVNTNGGSIEGTVLGKDERPAAGMMVVLVPPAERRANPDLYQTVRTDESGHFTVSGIPPGQYTLFASPTIQVASFQNADFLAKHSAHGSRLDVSDGLHMSTILKAMLNE